MNNGIKPQLNIIFVEGGKSKHKHRAINKIGEIIFKDADVASRSGIIQNLLSQMSNIYSEMGVNKVFDCSKKLFRHLATCSLENEDITLLTTSFISIEDFPTPKQKVYELNSSIFIKEVGSTFEQTRQFCRGLFKQIREVVMQCAPLDDDQAPESAINFYRFIAHLFTQSAVAPCDKRYPQKRWLLNLIEVCEQEDQEVFEWLKGYFELICQDNGNLTIATPETSVKYLSVIPFNPNNPHIIVPRQFENPLTSFINKDKERKQGVFKKATLFKQWYKGNREQILNSLKLKRQDIINNPRYAIMVDGSDEIKIQLSALYNVGIRTVSFYPGGLQFPNTKLSITARKDMYVMCDFWGSLSNLTFQGGDYIFANPIECDLSYLREVFTYVVIDALHTIVVGDDQPISHNQPSKAKHSIVSTDKSNVRQMRASIRRLPGDHKASKRAIGLASDHGWNLPNGKTFVSAHERPSKNEETSIAIKLKYTDEMCMDSLLV